MTGDSATNVAVLEWCPWCLDELRAGVPEDGICGHEELLAIWKLEEGRRIGMQIEMKILSDDGVDLIGMVKAEHLRPTLVIDVVQMALKPSGGVTDELLTQMKTYLEGLDANRPT